MSPALVEDENVFDLDVQIITDKVQAASPPCQTDDGCGHTCQISACNSGH